MDFYLSQRYGYSGGNIFKVLAAKQNIIYYGAAQYASNTIASLPTAPSTRGETCIFNSNGYPYIMLSTNGAIGSTAWTGTNKLGW